MKTKMFQLKEILPNPFRDLENNPLVESVVDTLTKSINQDEHKDLWQARPLAVRINDQDRPELVFGHHTLAALRRLHPSTWEIECAVEKLTDGQMISRMARENATRKSIDIQTLFEAIRAAVETYGAGRIAIGEGEGKMTPVPHTKPEHVRYAPKYSSSPAAGEDANYPYTMQTLATFLGFLQPNETATASFETAFGALELIKEGYLTEARIKGLEVFKIAEVVTIGKQTRKKAIEEAERKAAEVKKQKEEAERRAAELAKQKAEAETRRLAAIEAEKIAAQKRAEEKVKREAEEKIRLAAEAKRKEAEAKQRVIAEAKRKAEEAERKAIADKKRKEEEEKQRKIREEQQAKAKTMAEEAERQRQIAIAKARKEEDERKAAQIIKDAEAAKARAVAEAKRKEEVARQAEIAAKKKIEEDKAREIAAAQKREDEEKARVAAEEKKRADAEVAAAAQRKAKEEKEAREEAARIEAAKQKAIADKKAIDAAIAEAKRKADAAAAEASRKEEEAKKEAAAKKAEVKAVADKTAAAFANMTRKEIRANRQDVVHEAERQVAANAGRRVSPAPTHVSISDEKLKQFMDAMRNAPRRGVVSKTVIPRNVIGVAKELVNAGRKSLAAKRHPDAGGSEEEMRILNAAHQWLSLLISQNEEK